MLSLPLMVIKSLPSEIVDSNDSSSFNISRIWSKYAIDNLVPVTIFLI